MNHRGKIFFAVIALVIIFLLIYSGNDPGSNSFFPKCPFLALTGFQCPGCGSQRAIHHMLQGNPGVALHYNPLFVLALPYIFLGVIFEYTSAGNRYEKLRSLLFGYKTIYLILGIIIVFWIGRNLV